MALGATVAASGGACLAMAESQSVAVLLVEGLAVASGILLTIGLLTPAASGLVGLGALAVAFVPGASMGSPCLPPPPASTLMAISGAAVMLTGPGAFSVDARLFGRREIVIPHERPGGP